MNLRDHPGVGPARRNQVFAAMSNNRSGMELQGTRAAVLGSTSGIGRAVALALAHAGADVIVHGRTSRDQAEAVAALVRARGGRSAVL
ncbi:MAG TPA: SDR family NAD(P)-dependent oxidoreductase, partial [Isosphaeraceae bacterium]|nr:SDR family NAD(P)-dependent oxidoreductase [Isosphaeraceae bacterium]